MKRACCDHNSQLDFHVKKNIPIEYALSILYIVNLLFWQPLQNVKQSTDDESNRFLSGQHYEQ